MRLQKTKGIAWGVILALAVCSPACSPTPQEELARANKQLKQLQNSNARFYLQDELTTIRFTLQEVEGQLNKGNFKGAKKDLDVVKKLLDEAGKVYADRLKTLKEETYNLITYVNFNLDSVNTLVQNMPHKTYVDQNRRDIARFRMQTMQKQVQTIQEYISVEDYLSAQRQSPQINKSLHDLLQFVDIRPLSLESFKATANKQTTKVVAKSHASFARAN